jgi:hypothetical protein
MIPPISNLTKLPMVLGALDWGQWAYGLIAAFIGGGAGAFASGLGSIIVDPTDFNPSTDKFWKLIITTFVLAGLVPFFAFLHQKPLPDVRTVEKTVQTTIQATADSPKVVETVKETHTESLGIKPSKGGAGGE